MKKQIKLMSASVLTLIVAGALAPPASVLVEADDVTYPGWGAVGFQVPTDPTDPVDPENPSEPIDPDDPDQPGPPPGPGTPGPLSIDFASNFYFGSNNAISASNQTLNARLQPTLNDDGVAEERPNFVQVTDNRGTFAGWTLKVSATQFTVTDSSSPHHEEELGGAQMSWSNGTIVSTSRYPADGHTASHTFFPGNEVNAMWATEDNGAGTNLLRFGTTSGTTPNASSSVQLMVPGGAAREALYMSTITWSLQDVPPNGD
ncbi:WxL domain-containing protein [uncultured Lactococcus sp.]|uniref:WxL domain-containing protein n=1 Tax=uncultured Lactococcus sp. TaxID=167973 RepID=UPI0027DE23EE|nr:WxL domain-containing protein [uncultured Lactococcus sp.]